MRTNEYAEFSLELKSRTSHRLVNRAALIINEVGLGPKAGDMIGFAHPV